MQLKPFYRYFAPDPGAGGGGGGAAAVQPAEARTFVQSFVPDPKVLEGMDDQAVVAYHGRINEALDKVRPKANGAWPEKWREELAANDEKALAQLARYSSPGDVWKKARELEARITSGELRSLPPKDATPERIAAWRAENDIPPTPDKYEIKLPQGQVIGEADKPYFDTILAKLHDKGLSNAMASEMISAYYVALEGETKKAAEAEKKLEQETSDALNKEWGGDYRGNQNRIASLIDANVPADSPLKAMIQSTLKTNVEFAKLMERFARQIDPAGTLLPGGGAEGMAGLEDEIKSIEEKMKKAQFAGQGTPDYKAYFGDEKLQARYRELINAREALKARGG